MVNLCLVIRLVLIVLVYQSLVNRLEQFSLATEHTEEGVPTKVPLQRSQIE